MNYYKQDTIDFITPQITLYILIIVVVGVIIRQVLKYLIVFVFFCGVFFAYPDWPHGEGVSPGLRDVISPPSLALLRGFCCASKRCNLALSALFRHRAMKPVGGRLQTPEMSGFNALIRSGSVNTVPHKRSR